MLRQFTRDRGHAVLRQVLRGGARDHAGRGELPAGALRLGQALAPLRGCGVLAVGSGSLTHNLYEFRQHIRDPEYAQEFADWVRAAVAARDAEALVDYRRRAPHGERAHPTGEHYLPLLVAVGASLDTDTTRLVEGGMTYGVLSMDSFGFGLPEAANAALGDAA